MTCDEENKGAVKAVADALCALENEKPTVSYTVLAIVAIQAYKKWESSNN